MGFCSRAKKILVVNVICHPRNESPQVWNHHLLGGFSPLRMKVVRITTNDKILISHVGRPFGRGPTTWSDSGTYNWTMVMDHLQASQPAPSTYSKRAPKHAAPKPWRRQDGKASRWGDPSPVISGASQAITPYKWPDKWVSGVTKLLNRGYNSTY